MEGKRTTKGSTIVGVMEGKRWTTKDRGDEEGKIESGRNCFV